MKNSIILLLVLLASCANHSKGDKILQQFDSVNAQLKKIEAVTGPTNEQLYDSLWKLGNGTDKFEMVGEMAERVKDFHKYIGALKQQFNTACGDSSGEQLPEASEDSLALTNAFFLDKHSDAHLLLGQLQSVLGVFDMHATSELAKGMVHKLRSATVEKFSLPEKFMDLYFKNIPPVAAITILNSFEMQVKATEGVILKDYLNNK